MHIKLGIKSGNIQENLLQVKAEYPIFLIKN